MACSGVTYSDILHCLYTLGAQPKSKAIKWEVLSISLTRKLRCREVDLPKGTQSQNWTQIPLTLEQFFTVFNDCLSQRGTKVIGTHAFYHPQNFQGNEEEVSLGKEQSIRRHFRTLSMNPPPQRQLIWWSPWNQRLPIPKIKWPSTPKMHRQQFFRSCPGQSGEGRPRRKEPGLSGTQPTSSLKMEGRSISHWNNHYNTWISLKIFLKPFF